MFIINAMIPMANTKLEIEFECVNMLKIQLAMRLGEKKHLWF